MSRGNFTRGDRIQMGVCVYCTCPRSKSGNRGLGEVAVLFKKELSYVIQVVRKDENAAYMWISFKTGETRDVYIARCYFSPKNMIMLKKDLLVMIVCHMMILWSSQVRGMYY